MAKYCREKGVSISVYEEKPRRRSVSAPASRHHHHHHHHHLHHHYHDPDHDLEGPATGSGKGYNRRAQLLQYSRTLRESPDHRRHQRAETAASTPLLPKPKPTPSNIHQSTPNTVAVHRKESSEKRTTTPTCLGHWKLCIPSFLRSLINLKGKNNSSKKKKKKKHKQTSPGTNKMTALMKSIQVQKKRGFIPRLCSTFQKHK